MLFTFYCFRNIIGGATSKRWTCDQQVVGSIPILGEKLRNNLGQVVHTYVPLSPSSMTWYRPKGCDVCGWEGNRRPGGKQWQPTDGWMTCNHPRADCLYTRISSGPNARQRVLEAFTFTFLFTIVVDKQAKKTKNN